MTTIAQYYERANEAWQPWGASNLNRGTLPPLTPEEATHAAQRLYRYVTKDTWAPRPTYVTSGGNYSYIRDGVLRVNPERGWWYLIHDLSHSFHRLVSTAKPHSREHARLELRLVKEVIRRGWLDGKLKPERKSPSAVSLNPAKVKLERIEVRMVNWERKAKRAETALKKLRRQQKYYEKRVDIA